MGPLPPFPPVAVTAELAFYSGFWINLHHVLYAEAWARRNVPDKQRKAGAFPTPLTARLTADEHAAWDAAVKYYDEHYADHELLFDDDMRIIHRALSDTPDGMPATGMPSGLPEILERAAPVYRAHWWPAHDRANRAWIADTQPRVAQLANAVTPWLARRYGTPWFTDRVHVDVVYVSSRQGGYTMLDPTLITIGSTDADNQGWTAVETVYHEASHGLVKPVCEAFERAEAAAHLEEMPELCHVALFYLTGEVVRQSLAARGITYVPYLESTGLFDRAWPKLRAPIERAWAPYVNGEASLDDAVEHVVAAVTSGPP